MVIPKATTKLLKKPLIMVCIFILLGLKKVHYEKIDQSVIDKNSYDSAFVDKIISFKGLLKIFFFLSIQLLVLTVQIGRIFGNPLYLTNENFWNYNIPLLFQVILNYSLFFIILLFIFAFYLGKEIKMRRKEKIVLFSFKSFVVLIVFLIINSLFIFNFLKYYYLAKMNIGFYIYANAAFVFNPISELIAVWFFIISLTLLIKLSSFLIHMFSKKPSMEYSTQNIYPSGTNNKPKVVFGQPEENKQSNFQTSMKGENKEDDYLTKEQIISMQQAKITEVKANQQKEQNNNENNNQSEPVASNTKTPNSFITFLQNKFFCYPLIEQIIIFFTLSELFWLTLFTIDLFSNTNSFTQFNNYYTVSSMISNYAVFEFIFYIVASLIYYDILKSYFTIPYKKARKDSLILLALGTLLIFVSLSIASFFQSQYIVSFIIIKYIILALIPAFYFGYKSQNQTNSDFNRFNPVFNFLYNKSINELRENEKSAEIIKKFLQIHKEDIRRSLINATPINFKENIKNVIINDYDRLETLLAYNNVTTKSKVAIIDYTMEVFSTFLINLEVNLQDIYTEHLLKSSPENLHNPIGNDFIESKFAKLFSQWESLDWSRQ